MNAKIEEIAKKLNKAKNIAVFCHVRPDGDALGSSFALWYVLKALGKSVNVVTADYGHENEASNGVNVGRL